MEQLEPRVLMISHDVVGSQMAGPGIRYYHLARVLASEFDLTLAVPFKREFDWQVHSFQIVTYERRNWTSLEPLVKQSTVVFAPSDIASDFPQLAQSGVPLIIDGYDPLLAEWLQLTQSTPEEQQMHWVPRMCDLNRQYLSGDFFVCASERQRDWWLGLLEANGRINPWTFQDDPSLRRLIDVVPYGLPDTIPQHTQRIIKGVWSGIGEQDRVILWGGGLWPWLDPLTAIRAVAKVWQHRQDVRLIFPGTRHPNPMLAGIPTHTESSRQLAEEFGLLNKGIFFGDWVPYGEWHNVLLESDIAITLHFDGLETRLAFRSRVLDYIWAGLPIVAARGDATSDLVKEHDLGVMVDCQDVDAVSEAILRLLEMPRQIFSDRFEKVRRLLTWSRVVQPLVAFCRNPRRAADKQGKSEPPGNPFYSIEIDRLNAEIEILQSLVRAYERRRVVRMVDALHRKVLGKT